MYTKNKQGDRLPKNLQVSNFKKNLFSKYRVVRCAQKDGRTDMTKPIVAFAILRTRLKA